ncbi:MAG TPA: PCYCGC motif-containing (lipo)protein [Vicinamibacterales bacterium]|nr:PCYCGC motif-containing (lipo)protein [Vicinamibacterales bacterium]
MRLSIRVGVVMLALVTVAGVAVAARQAVSARPAAKTPAATSSRAPAPALAPLPRLNTAGYALARPLALTRAVYEFVARHPEVSKHVPCYCGCEADGHRNNENCFIDGRDAAGNVTSWDPHGFSCAICVDVAKESMQLYNSGADPASIRTAIEKKWTPQYRTKTPTPPVPPKKR